MKRRSSPGEGVSSFRERRSSFRERSSSERLSGSSRRLCGSSQGEPGSSEVQGGQSGKTCNTVFEKTFTTRKIRRAPRKPWSPSLNQIPERGLNRLELE